MILVALALCCFLITLALIAHHYKVHGVLVNIEDVDCHEVLYFFFTGMGLAFLISYLLR